MELANILGTKEKMNVVEAYCASQPQVHLPLEHRFTSGMYIRTIFMPAGTVVTSRTHKTDHPFVVQSGVVDVYDESGRCERFSSGHLGTTKAGTRRILMVHADCTWTTFHATDKTDPEEIGEEITEASNDLLPEGFRQLWNNTKEELWLGQ
jgi:hypothetical protein